MLNPLKNIVLGLSTAIITTPLCFAAEAAAPPTSQPSMTPEQMIDRIGSLETEVSQLKTQTQAEHQLLVDEQQRREAKAQENPADVAVAIQQVMDDADNHSALLDTENITAGYESRRFYIQSSDGNFLLRPWIHIQVRDGTAYRKDGLNSTTDDVQNGLEIRRARLGFDGNLFTPNLTYYIDWATYRGNSSGNVVSTTPGTSGSKIGTVLELNGGTPVLEEAWIKDRINGGDFYLKAGQVHDPLDHEAIIGSKYRAPEASLTGDIFANTDTFTQAATVIYDPKQAFRFEGGLTDGIRAANTNFEDTPNNGIAYRWGVAGRAEIKAMGDWNDYNQLTALDDKKDLLVFGLGADYSEGQGFNSLSFTPDVQFADPCGLFFYGSYFGRITRHNPGIVSGAPVSTAFGTPGVTGENTYEYSGLAQVAYLIHNKWEPYVRYEYLDLKGTPAGSQNFVNEFSLGVNYYMYGHNAKITVQGMYLPNGIPVNDDSSDVLISNNKQELVLIAQFQLLL